MKQPGDSIGRIYGYTVCFVAVLAFLYASVEVARGVMELREPPYTETYRTGPSLASIEAYRADLLGPETVLGSGEGEADGAPEAILWRMYQAEREYRLALSHHVSRKKVVVHLVVQLLAALFFASHWIWLRRRERASPAGGG